MYTEFLYLEDDARKYSTFKGGARRDLANLRLVNRAFCRSASPWLFRHINAECTSSLVTPSLERLIQLSKSPYATCVCQIDFGFKESLPSDAITLYIEALAEWHSSLLVKFTNLRALGFHEPPLSLPQAQRAVYMGTVISILRYAPLPNLSELEVRFPITHDFGRFFPNRTNSLQIPIEDILQHLRHLELCVCAYTDSADQRHRQTPVLPEYAALPNGTYAPHLFRMVENAPKLESLILSSVNILDFDSVTFPSTLCLESLHLGGVSISSDVLLSLINQSAHKMKYISFWLVKLKSGTWQQVLLQLCKLPRLLDINIDYGGYTLTGSSSHLADRLLPSPECRPNIETMHTLDLTELGNLQWQVNSNRIAIGLQPFPDTDYRHINKPSLEFEG